MRSYYTFSESLLNRLSSFVHFLSTYKYAFLNKYTLSSKNTSRKKLKSQPITTNMSALIVKTDIYWKREKRNCQHIILRKVLLKLCSLHKPF